MIGRCLAKDPAERYVRADELARALRRAAPAGTAPGGARGGTEHRDPAATALIVRKDTAALHPPQPARSRPRTGRAMLGVSIALLALGGLLVAVPAISAMSSGTIRPHVRAPKPIPVPTGLRATTACDGFFSTRAELSWIPGGRSKGYEIWRKEPGVQTFQLVARISDRSVTSYSDTALGIDQTYHYVVRATTGARVSAPSPEASAPTPLLCLA